eukprot:COSAG01_NODE_51355_length_355_cov_1.046875_1_plen_48_part_01
MEMVAYDRLVSVFVGDIAGQEITGGSLSKTTKFTEQVPSLPTASRAKY